ncbi:MAG: hypothetical protein IPH88_14465 [Bacteroidales bacterium]|nr:hypothetical protein [Bacteroidales bacterium]
MKKIYLALLASCLLILSQSLLAQAPEKLNYQAVIFDSQNALVRNTAIGMRISILEGSIQGNIVYQETYNPNPQTNGNGMVSVEIGGGLPIVGNFSQINWAVGTYFIMSETDITGGTNYTITGTSPILSVPYALHAKTSADAFSRNYDDLTNKPVTDGSETKIAAGTNIQVLGTGTATDPYTIHNTATSATAGSKVVLTSTQTYTVPQGASKIKVELWGASGGGGGAGAYSYSYNLVSGGEGGGGGFASQEMTVTPGQQISLTIGTGSAAGQNAVNSGGNYIGDTDGGDGGDSFFGDMKAAGGLGGRKGSTSDYPVNGSPGTDNIGAITAHPSLGGYNQLDIYFGLERSYIAERKFTSLPGIGGSLTFGFFPTAGEAGCAIITVLE